jgi:hypothetical protein
VLLHCHIIGFAVPTPAQEKQQPLRLTQTIPLPGAKGRLDHMGVDLEKKRLFVAAVTNNTLEVVDLTGGKVINSLAGFKDTQDALFLGGDFNKLYLSSLDGHVRVFQGRPFRLVQDFKIEPGPNRLRSTRPLRARNGRRVPISVIRTRAACAPRKSSSQQTLRWREPDSNPRSPVGDAIFRDPGTPRRRTGPVARTGF